MKVNEIKEVGIKKIQEGNDTARQCDLALDNILTKVREVSTKISEIDAASNEQATGISEINNAMNSLSDVTNQTTSIANKNTESADQLSGESTRLKEIFQMLDDLVMGAKSSSQLNQSHSVATQDSSLKEVNKEGPKQKLKIVGDKAEDGKEEKKKSEKASQNVVPQRDDELFEDL